MSSATSTPQADRPSLFWHGLTFRRFFTGRRWWLAVSAGAALAVLVALWPTAGAAATLPGPAPRPLAVVAAPAELVEGYVARRTYTGELRPRRSADLGWEQGGRVAEVRVDEGDLVEAGEVLAELEDERARAELDGLRAARAREAALLTELVRGPRTQTVQVARAEVERLEDELELAELQRERRAGLVERKVATLEELDVARTRARTAGSQLEAARQALDELEEGTRVEDLDQQRAALAELDARIARAEVELSDRALRAPFDGVVTRRDLDEGAVVPAGVSVLRVIEASALEARIGVPAERVTALRPGDPVELEIRGRATPATVRSLVPEIDPATRTADVVVALSAEESLRHVAGEVARLTLEERVDRQGAWVPTAALVPGKRGLWAVYAVVPSADDPYRTVIERRELEVLHTTGSRSLVRGTLRGGEQVVVEGIHRVVPGQLVAVN
jgi:multidrug efflux pump subunit AcrA (membrane-fusion protein)